MSLFLFIVILTKGRINFQLSFIQGYWRLPFIKGDRRGILISPRPHYFVSDYFLMSPCYSIIITEADYRMKNRPEACYG